MHLILLVLCSSFSSILFVSFFCGFCVYYSLQFIRLLFSVCLFNFHFLFHSFSLFLCFCSLLFNSSSFGTRMEVSFIFPPVLSSQYVISLCDLSIKQFFHGLTTLCPFCKWLKKYCDILNTERFCYFTLPSGTVYKI